jgi:hypothetical protein
MHFVCSKEVADDVWISSEVLELKPVLPLENTPSIKKRKHFEIISARFLKISFDLKNLFSKQNYFLHNKNSQVNQKNDFKFEIQLKVQ